MNWLVCVLWKAVVRIHACPKAFSSYSPIKAVSSQQLIFFSIELEYFFMSPYSSKRACGIGTIDCSYMRISWTSRSHNYVWTKNSVVDQLCVLYLDEITTDRLLPTQIVVSHFEKWLWELSREPHWTSLYKHRHYNHDSNINIAEVMYDNLIITMGITIMHQTTVRNHSLKLCFLPNLKSMKWSINIISIDLLIYQLCCL